MKEEVLKKEFEKDLLSLIEVLIQQYQNNIKNSDAGERLPQYKDETMGAFANYSRDIKFQIVDVFDRFVKDDAMRDSFITYLDDTRLHFRDRLEGML